MLVELSLCYELLCSRFTVSISLLCDPSVIYSHSIAYASAWNLDQEYDLRNSDGYVMTLLVYGCQNRKAPFERFVT